MAAELACAHGLTTGLYTSPHLVSVRERLSVCGVDITEEEFAEEYEHLLPYLMLVDSQGEEQVTYFEALTALAYLWFADKPVALGVFEVGMGGTWDATNLVRGDVAVLTPIALDHPELGSTVAEVAGEKAGIIKEGTIAVSREQDAEALARDRGAVRGDRRGAEARVSRLRARGAAAGHGRPGAADPRRRARPTTICSCRCSASTPRGTRPRRSWRVEALIDKPLDEATTREALAAVRWPGRLEIVARHPTVLLDGAHNPAGAEALAVALREFFIWDRLHLVISISANKDVERDRPAARVVGRYRLRGNERQRTLRRRRWSIAEEFARARQAGRAVRFDRGGARRGARRPPTRPTSSS